MVYAMALSVCLSVCLSYVEMAEQSRLVFRVEATLGLSYIVF